MSTPQLRWEAPKLVSLGKLADVANVNPGPAQCNPGGQACNRS